MKKIVIINGTGGVGKSTFCQLCKEVLVEKNIEVLELSTIDWPKKVAKFCGWDGSKEEKDRKFLSDLKKSLEDWDNSPTISVINNIKALTDEKDYVIFVNCREPKNINIFKQLCQDNLQIEPITLLIRNKNVAPITSNVSDANVENYNYNYIAYNNETLEHLKLSAKVFLDFLFKT